MPEFEKNGNNYIEDVSEKIDLRAELNKYLRYWYWFVLGALLCLLAGWLYLRYTTPEYNISSTLLIKDDKKGSDLGGAAFSDLDIFKTQKSIDNEIEVLKSKSLMQRVFELLPLKASVFAEGRFKKSEVYKDSTVITVNAMRVDSAAYKIKEGIKVEILDNFTFNLTDSKGKTKYRSGEIINKPYARFVVSLGKDVKNGEDYTIRFNDLRLYADNYNNKLSVAPVNKDASVLNISMIDASPEKAIDIINTLITQYNIEAIQDKNQISSNTIKFIDERLIGLVGELSGVERDVANLKGKYGVTDVTTDIQRYSQQAIEFYKQQEEAKIKTNVINSIQSYMNRQGALVPSALGIEDPALNGLIQSYNELQQQRTQLLNTEQEGSVLVQNVDKNIASLKSRINENLKVIERGANIAQSNLQRNFQQFQGSIQNVPDVERQLLEIRRQQSKDIVQAC